MSDRKYTPTPETASFDFSEEDSTPVEMPQRMHVVLSPLESDELDTDAPLWEQVLHAVKSQERTLVAMQANLQTMYLMLQGIVPRLSAIEQQLAHHTLHDISSSSVSREENIGPEVPDDFTTDPRT